MNNIDPYNNAPPPRDGGGGCSTGSCGRPAQPQMPPPQAPGQIDPQQMIHMLQSDLNTAIAYIRQLGGQWPPPGQ